nr:TDP-N-acetylfucosamine:lipid II N-acetylfucosaminyltransferase [uncultured Bacteroides sp.]
MILHLVNDEKIINRTIDIFDAAFPGENLFIVFRKRNISMVRSGENIISYQNFDVAKYKEQATSIIIHLMTNRKIRFINRYFPNLSTIYWVMWGSDSYGRLFYPKGLKLIDTESRYYQSQRVRRFFLGSIDKLDDWLRILRRMHFIRQRVQSFVTSTIEDDHDVLLKYYPDLKSKPWGEFSYYPIDVVMGSELKDVWAEGSNIQIGHCGSHTNNHEYAFRILSKLDIHGKVIVPLSYSGKKEYKEAVIKQGQRLFGESFIPIMDFLPLADYNRLMASSSFAIYANWRQEAVGNILVSLYLGSKVFLSNRNPILGWARRHGFIVFELEKIGVGDLATPLAEKDRFNNRNILLRDFDSTALYRMMRNTFSNR